jgi:hypothetical protein
MIQLIVARPVYERVGSVERVKGYEHYLMTLALGERLVLATDEKVMFAVPARD